MPRAVWNGSISFGLVTIPVKLYNAVSRKSVSFNQIDTRTGSRIKYKKVSAADDEEVPPEAIARGYEHVKGSYVLVDDDELAALLPKSDRMIGIEAFVDEDDIEPIFYDTAFHVAPASGFEKPYALLEQAMKESGRVALARFVRNNKEYLAALRPRGGRLELSTMVYADELVDPESIDELTKVSDVEVGDEEVEMARQLIESLAADFQPERYEDTYRTQLTELLERKAAGEEIVAPSAGEQPDTKVVDLLSALEASVEAAKEARGRHPSSRPKDDEKRPAAKKKQSRKRAAKKKAATRKSA